jgi:hypothetical protein
MKKFLALVVADLEKEIIIKDNVVNIKIGPVYQNGYEFSGEVIVEGTTSKQYTTTSINNLVAEYLHKHTDLIQIRKIEIRDIKEQEEHNQYRRAS